MDIWRGLVGHTLKNVEKMPNSWTDRDQIWHMYTVHIHQGMHIGLNINPSSPKGHLEEGRRSQIRNVGKKPNSWPNREQIWDTYAKSSGNGHELKN